MWHRVVRRTEWVDVCKTHTEKLCRKIALSGASNHEDRRPSLSIGKFIDVSLYLSSVLVDLKDGILFFWWVPVLHTYFHEVCLFVCCSPPVIANVMRDSYDPT